MSGSTHSIAALFARPCRLTRGIALRPVLRAHELLLSRQVESEGLLRLWEGLKDAESTFFEQSEQIADRIEQLEVLVDR